MSDKALTPMILDCDNPIQPCFHRGWTRNCWREATPEELVAALEIDYRAARVLYFKYSEADRIDYSPEDLEELKRQCNEVVAAALGVSDE